MGELPDPAAPHPERSGSASGGRLRSAHRGAQDGRAVALLHRPRWPYSVRRPRGDRRWAWRGGAGPAHRARVPPPPGRFVTAPHTMTTRSRIDSRMAAECIGSGASFGIRRREAWRVFLLYAALTVAFTWPLALDPAGSLMPMGTDGDLFLWPLAWDGHGFISPPLAPLA